MAKNKKKENAGAKPVETKKEQAAKAKRNAKLTTIFIAAFVAVAIIAVSVVGVIAIINAGKQKEDDRLENATFDSDISEYIFLSPDIYSKFDVKLDFNKPTAKDVENEIIKLIFSNKGDVSERDVYNTAVGIKAGDEVTLLYRAYYMDGESKVYFAEGTNMAEGFTTVAIGEDKFFDDLELALVDLIADEYRSLVTVDAVGADSILTLTFGEESVVVDMTSDVDAACGDGFKAALLGKGVGDTVTATDKGDGRIANIYSPDVADLELPTLSVEVTLPDDFVNESLRGREVVFETYISNVRKFNAPRYNDAFVTSTLKLTAEDLADYEGETLAEKYKSKLRAELGEDADVEYEILKTLYANRQSAKTDEGWRDDEPIKAGDIASIYYRGYYMQDGKRVYFDGGCNFGSEYTNLGIGEGGFVAGFELGLVGKTPTDYLTYDTVTAEGAKVGERDMITISYAYAPYSGSTQSSVTAVINMADEKLDETWGKGFRELLLGAELGKTLSSSHLRETVNEQGNTETDVFMSIRVDSIYSPEESRADKDVLTVDVVFPADYESEELRNRAATFEVYVVNVQKYDVPVFDESFIAKTLKVTPADLSDYEGETLVEKYEAKLMADLLETYEDNVLTAVSERMWEVYLDAVEVKRLPTGNVMENYDSMVAEIEYGYEYYNQYYSGMYSSLDQFAAEYMGVSASTWREEAMKQSEEAVTKQLVFYYVIKESNFIPTKEVEKAMYEEDYQAQLEAYLEQGGCTPDKYETEAEYEAKKAELSETFASNYDEYYATENVRYNYGLEKIYEEYANIITE